MEGTLDSTTPMSCVQPVVVQGTNSSHHEKPEKFNRQNFKRWHQKMLFYLTTLSLKKWLTEDPLEIQEGENHKTSVTALDAWKHSDFLCKNYILNCLDNKLYTVYCMRKSAKELWETLEMKYKTEDAGKRKYIVDRFMEYKMVESKTVVSQMEELQIIISECHEEGLVINEPFQVAAIIGKLPPSWTDFKNYLKHKNKEITINKLVVKLCVEENNRQLGRGGHFGQSNANMVESSSGANNGKGQKREFKGESSKGNQKAKQFNGICFNCGKQGHGRNECRKPWKVEQTNVAEIVTDSMDDLNLST